MISHVFSEFSGKEMNNLKSAYANFYYTRRLAVKTMAFLSLHNIGKGAFITAYILLF
jgi:hypothetical protein